MELYISRNGAKISKVKESFRVKSDEQEYILSSEKIKSIILESECSLTSGVIRLAFEKDIPIIITDIYGNIMGQFYKSNGTKNGKLKKEQYKFFSSDNGMEIAKEWVIEKILNQKIHLEKLLKRRKKSTEALSIFNNYIKKIEDIKGNTDKNRDMIMGFEGITSRIYFRTISEIMEKNGNLKKENIKMQKSHIILF